MCQKYCNGAYSRQHVSHRIWVVVCVLFVCRIYFFSKLCNTLLLHFLCDWGATWCIVTNIRKNYPGNSHGKSPDLQAGVVILKTAMGKWLLACLQMAISTGPTLVFHIVTLSDVAIFQRNSRTNFDGVCTNLSLLWWILTKLRQKCEPEKLSWYSNRQGRVESPPWLNDFSALSTCVIF